GGEEPAVAGGPTTSTGDAGVAQWRSAAPVVAAAAVAAAVHRGRGCDPLRGPAVGVRTRWGRGRAAQGDRAGASGTRARASGRWARGLVLRWAGVGGDEGVVAEAAGARGERAMTRAWWSASGPSMEDVLVVDRAKLVRLVE